MREMKRARQKKTKRINEMKERQREREREKKEMETK